ncbi:MAG TPA: hypothetical protein VGC09_01365, partial [Rhodopila sp.]
MTGSVHPRPLLPLMLALLAVSGLLWRGQNVAAMSGEILFAAFPVAVCHTGVDDRRPGAPSPMPDCDACLVCIAAHGLNGAPALVPAGAELPAMSAADLRLPAPAAWTAPRFGPHLCARA